MTRNELAKAKDDFIAKRQQALRRKVGAIEKRVLEAVFDAVVKRLKLDQGKVLSDADNKKLVNQIDRIIERAAGDELKALGEVINGDLSGIANANGRYFQTVAETTRENIVKIRDAAQQSIGKQLGFTESGKLKPGGYFDRLLTTKPLQSGVKKTLLKGLAANVPIAKLRKDLQTVISGNNKVDGTLTRYFEQSVTDTYNQYDRTINAGFAKKLNLRAAIYAGGTIQTTRCFCRENNGKVFTDDEIEQWKPVEDDECTPIWHDDLGVYKPKIHLGGIRCRHSLDWISAREAIRRRPELRVYFDQG
jgi:hypothetical protein